MSLEDRVITTDQLRAVNSGISGWLQLGPGILDRLEPVAFHVLVPSGHVHISDDDAVMSCIAELQVGTPTPLEIRVLVPHHLYLRLPRAFDVLARIHAAATGIVSELEAWMGKLDEVDDAVA